MFKFLKTKIVVLIYILFCMIFFFACLPNKKSDNMEALSATLIHRIYTTLSQLQNYYGNAHKTNLFHVLGMVNNIKKYPNF